MALSTTDAKGSIEYVSNVNYSDIHKGTNGYPNGHDHANCTLLNGSHPGRHGKEAPVNRTHVPIVASPEPIAICGMSVRLPGGLHSPQQLWDFLVAKGDARGPVPKSRYNASAYYSEASKPGSVNTEYGYFLDESIDLATVDTSFFTMGRSEVERMDPHQRQMLEVARECMEDAGETDWKGRQIGCYMGSFGEDWAEMFAKENQQYGLYRVSGSGDFMLPNRVSYEMDLTGPSMTVRTGCSAALVALHEACLAVSRGDCEGAIVGGANLIMGPGMTTAMTEQGVLAPDGSCKSFSADANGYARGEAISAIFIKPLADAIRDGNPVRAVIRATASNSDGKGTASGIQVPNDIAQEAMIRRAYMLAGITDYSETAFVECHGTGTSVGDPIEARAVGRVFGPSGGVQIGSVKPNLGHSEGASGLTSLIKSVLALENRVIPPNIKFNKPNPEIPWDSCGLSVPTEPMTWPESRRERISVNSFGIGGTNAHVILDSAQSFGISPVPKRPTVSPQLLVYSANNHKSLTRMITQYNTYIEKNPDRVSDLAFTLANGREHLPYRAFAVQGLFHPAPTSAPMKSGPAPNIVMVFTGQGAQWPQMGQCMIHSCAFPVFKKTIQSLDAHLRTLTHVPIWNIEDELLKTIKTSRLSSAELSQPLCTAIQVALVDTFASVGIRPTAVVGHSSGEVAAAYAAGAITANEAITIAFYRGQVAKLQTKSGVMAAIGMGSDDVQGYLQPGVIVACDNSPKSVTLAGDTEAVELVVDQIKEDRPDVIARQLQVDKAYHSHHMAEIGDKYHALIEHEVSAKTPTKLFFSSVEGKLLSKDSILDSKYWQKNLESPVLFRSAVSSILQHDIAKNMVFLEVGPHSALAGPLRQIQTKLSNSSPYVSALIRNQNDEASFLAAIGQLYVLNATLNLGKVTPKGSILPDLPRYPWDHSTKFWYESRLSKEWRQREHKYHDLLGVRVPESLEFDVLFRNLFHLNNAPWIKDHRVGTDIVFPFAGYAGMIGEAVRQVTGVNEAFKLRNIVVSTALVLNEGQPVEIMTTLRHHRLTDSLDSDWWEFTIASHNGTIWTKHCSGEARSHSEKFGQAEKHSPLVRKVDTRRCYESMARSGLNFGSTFQRLDNIRSDTTTQIATSELVAKETDGKDYHLHPTVIDASLQLLCVAASKGYADSATKMMVPTSIEEMCIYRCNEDVQVRASASYTPNGSIFGSGQCVADDGKLVLRSSGIRLSVLDGQDSGKSSDATARIEWGPDIYFLDVKTFIKPLIDRSDHMPLLTELSHLCMIHTRRVIADVDTPINHMHKYRSWIDGHLKSVDFQSLDTLDNATIEQRVKHIGSELSQTLGVHAAIAIQKIFNNAKKIFTGDVEALDLLLSDDTLANLYESMDQCDTSQFFKHLTHSKPNLRVLEIGAGTGGSTAKILKFLTPSDKTLYSKYTFTDISSGFFVAAKERLSTYPNIEYATLDISKDPSEQGFSGRKYDLILAANVIHATRSLNESLSNIRQLLDPNGWLLLQELSSTSKSVNYIFGTLPDWWYGDADGRLDEPYVSIERWAKELKAAGFRIPDAAVRDSPEPHQLYAMIVARPAIQNVPKKCVTLLSLSESKCASPIVQGLESRGYAVYCCGLQDMPLPISQDVIAMLDYECPFFENMDDQRFDSFKSLVESLKECGILWVTALSQVRCQDPRFGMINGIARTIRSEMLVDFATCEVDDVGSSVEKIIDVFAKFQRRQEDDILKPEFEYAIVNNTVHVGRFHPFPLQERLLTSNSDDTVALRTSKPGHLNALHWACEEIKALDGDDVEVETYATGLNFRDVLSAMGIVEASESGFGLEAAGIVRRTGPNVKDLQPGNRVMLIGQCTFATRVIVSENLCEKIPGGLSFEDAATMPCVFATSIYSIFNIGNLQKGQSILIHSACGGVGIATVQLAQMIGAEIYVTVSNEEKVKYLMDTFGLPRNKIFNSRDTSFVENILRETGGKGVDLALNSLSGELLHATWKCIAVFGKMVEIGKRDLIGSGKLDMKPFLANRNYCCVDLDQICSMRPTIAKGLLKNIVDLLKERHIHPIRPIKVFNSDVIIDAFRFMQQGVHLGKIVVSMRNAAGQVNMGGNIQQRKNPTRFDSSGAYLLVGGLGGLGRSVSTWMVERGACHLIYLSRSAGANKKHQEFAEELSSMGCRANFVQGSVSNLADVTKAVTQAQGRLKGILQMSMVLCDQSFPQMTLEEWNTAVDPKVKGTWNLHCASVSANAGLDFFVLFSSMSGIIGQPGQANYAGANAFLDAFSQYRMGLGLPACAVEIGAVEEVGYLTENESVRQKLKAGGSVGTISERELLEAIEAAITPTSSKSRPTSSGNFCLGIRSSLLRSNQGHRSLWKKDVRMAVFHNSGETSTMSDSASTDSLKAFITAAKSDPALLRQPDSAHLLAVEIGKKVFSFLLKPEEDLQTSCSLSDLGMDSLVAIDVRQWWKATFQFDISVLEMMGMGTLDALGEHAAKGMLKSFQGGEDQVG
ncbi:polyketide synthase [Penicillium subrubescens]|uniref:Lovastatin diketide synthase LovF n=1 Tax=Penicillium subrubescens TaxID=1316194 RepID=A0A1Q5TTZ4_9EURO|nr:polyketide synthase [Penicillium subrubescens]KAJ5900212.1 polyketide synthase [Penicillium subrubescens]OKP03706.1 Lovastatin diketide synthase LovF [Penicillium subrubescens]